MKFAHCDTRKPDGFYVQFERKVIDDFDRPDPLSDPDNCVVAVRAIAKCLIVRNHVGTYVNLESPGLWGIEIDDNSDEYLNEVYREEIAELKGMIAAMHDPIYEGE